MSTNKKRKSSREKRVLVASLVVASVIVAGSTFAWFTSRDEVTNRLTATVGYGVSVTENFTPPTDWLPGQEVSKDVFAVNTGNIPAFVKMQLEGTFDIDTEVDGGIALPNGSETIINDTLNGKKLKPLFVSEGAEYDERTAIQAGGYLAYAPAGVTTQRGIIDENFVPTKTGLYLFRRQVVVTANNNTSTTKYDFSGYYYDDTTKKYYALVTYDDGVDVIRGLEYEIPRDTGDQNDIAGIKLRAYEANPIPSGDTRLKWDYNNVSNGIVKVKYQPGSTANPSKDIDIEIKLKQENLAGAEAKADKWQYIADHNAFYYSTALDPSATSSQLVDSVTLSKDVKDTAFSRMNFDLTVKLNSVQVTKNADEEEITESAESEFGIVPDGDITYGTGENAKKIEAVKWKVKTN